MREPPSDAIALIKTFEDCSLIPYHDCVGFPTVGWGHLLSRQRCADLSLWRPITQETADAYLVQDVARACRGLTRLVSVPLSDGQYGALVDFVFNLGVGQFEISTLRKVINRGEFDDAPTQFVRWVYAGGQRLAGLVRRRREECKLWTS